MQDNASRSRRRLGTVSVCSNAAHLPAHCLYSYHSPPSLSSTADSRTALTQAVLFALHVDLSLRFSVCRCVKDALLCHVGEHLRRFVSSDGVAICASRWLQPFDFPPPDTRETAVYAPRCS